MKKNSGNSPTLSSNTTDSATLLKKLREMSIAAISVTKMLLRLSTTLTRTPTELLPLKRSEKLLKNLLLIMTTNSQKRTRDG